MGSATLDFTAAGYRKWARDPNIESGLGCGGRSPHALSKAQVRLAQAAMAQRDTKVSELCLQLGVTKATIYRYVAPDGSLRNRGRQVLAR